MPSYWQVTLLSVITTTFVLSKISRIGLPLCLFILLPIHLFFAAVWNVLLWPFVFSPLRNIPEPKGASWIHGHRRLVKDKRCGHPQDVWINEVENDGLLRYRLKFNSELLMVTNSKGLAEVLVQKSYDFSKPMSLRLGLGRILGVGIIVAEGDEHKKQRRNLLPAFAHRHVKNLYPIFWAKAFEVVDKLNATIQDGVARGDHDAAVVDLPGWIARTTLDIIGVAGMGRDLHAIENPDNEVCNAYNSVFEGAATKSKSAMFHFVLEELISHVYPIKRRDTIAIASESLKDVGRRFIVEKQTRRAETGKLEETDIISVMLKSGGFTDENLVNQFLTFLAAGHETTATSIAWAVVALTQNPDVQHRLRKEIRDGLPTVKDLAKGMLSPEVLDSLPYLHAVCNEVLRMYPPAGLTKRTANKDTSILGQFVPAGTNIIMCMRAINHSFEHWGQDAMEFRPDRWLGPGNWNSGGADNNYSYMTFLHGPRSCIGQGFAKAEFAILLAVLVDAFEIETEPPNAPVVTETGLTTRPRGLKVRLTPIVD